MLLMHNAGCLQGQSRLSSQPVRALAPDISHPYLLWVAMQQQPGCMGIDVRIRTGDVAVQIPPTSNSGGSSPPYIGVGGDFSALSSVVTSTSQVVSLWDVRNASSAVEEKSLNDHFPGGWGHGLSALSLGSRGRVVTNSVGFSRDSRIVLWDARGGTLCSCASFKPDAKESVATSLVGRGTVASLHETSSRGAPKAFVWSTTHTGLALPWP